MSEDWAKRLPPRLSRWALELRAAADITGMDAYLLAAIMDRESLGGEALSPRMAQGTGDNGHGRGLMQLDDRTHQSFIYATDDVGRPLWHVPALNVMYGALLLARYVAAFSGVVACGVCAYNAGPGRVKAVLYRVPDAKGDMLVSALDVVTSGKNYVSAVLTARDAFRNTGG